MNRLYKPLSVMLLFALIAGAFFAAVPQSAAQGNATAAVTPTTDDSDDLPVLINVSGKVKSISTTAIQVGTTTIAIPAGIVIPAEIKVDVTVTIRANLRNDDTFSLITIVVGTPPPTAAATAPAILPAVTPTTTLSATAPATLPATQAATLPATLPAITPTTGPTPTFFPGCDKTGTGQNLALVVSAAFGVPYNDVIKWHCQGFSFGVIARAYLIVITAEAEGKPTTVLIVLNLRRQGQRWSLIIIFFGINPQPDSIIIVLVGGGNRFTIFRDCFKYKGQKFRPCENNGKGNGNGDDNGKKKGKKDKGGEGDD